MTEYDYGVKGVKCDFCSSPYIAWRFPCEDFPSGDLGLVDDALKAEDPHGYKNIPSGTVLQPLSRGDWAACQTCYEMVMAGEWKSLAARTYESDYGGFKKIRGMVPRRFMLKEFMKLHAKFRKHRCGDPVPDAPDWQTK